MTERPGHWKRPGFSIIDMTILGLTSDSAILIGTLIASIVGYALNKLATMRYQSTLDAAFAQAMNASTITSGNANAGWVAQGGKVERVPTKQRLAKIIREDFAELQSMVVNGEDTIKLLTQDDLYQFQQLNRRLTSNRAKWDKLYGAPLKPDALRSIADAGGIVRETEYIDIDGVKLIKSMNIGKGCDEHCTACLEREAHDRELALEIHRRNSDKINLGTGSANIGDGWGEPVDIVLPFLSPESIGFDIPEATKARRGFTIYPADALTFVVTNLLGWLLVFAWRML